MKDLTDYFRRHDNNDSIGKVTPIAESKVVLIDCQIEERARNHKREKRKLELASESENSSESENKKNFFKEQSKSKLEDQCGIFDTKCIDYSNNLTIRLTKVDDQLAKNESNENKKSKKIRYLKNIVVEDCFNFIDKTTLKKKNSKFFAHDESKVENSESKKSSGGKKKRRPTSETDDTDSYELNSSDGLFKVDEKPKKTYSRKSGRLDKSTTRPNTNNLLNYFSKTNISSRSDESPVKRSKTMQVVALVHSPPKARIKENSSSNDIKENRSPIVKIVRSDAFKVNSYDEIKVVATDIIDAAGICHKQEASGMKSDEDSSSSEIFSPVPRNIQPWKMRVQFAASGKNLILKKLKPKSKLKEDVKEDLKNDKKETLKEGVKQISEVNIKKTSKKNVTETAKKDVKRTSKKDKNKKEKKVVKNFDSDDDSLVEMSDSSQDETVPKRKRKTPLNSDDDSAPKMMESSSISLPNRIKESSQSEPKKLAPLFCKKYDQKMKPKPVPMINHEARRLFLESGVPDELKKKLKQEEQKSFPEENLRPYTFPKSNHIQQKDPGGYIWNLTNVSEDLKLKPLDEDVHPESSVISGLINNDTPPVVILCDQVQYDVQDEVAALKKLEPDVNVGDIFSSVKRLYKEAACENNAICWTDKYKPSCYNDLIGNSGSVVKLKDWIESHKRRKITLEGDNSSSEEFIDSDDSSSSVNGKNNVAMVVGPPGCGKTCAVYMLANELGFKVLEVNAASNRNGKRILDELLEATQSHRVKRTTVFDKEVKKSNKKKKKIKQEKKTMSLILIEDADILFENYDEGFLSALNSLTAQSKRPFIFTMNDINYPHLARYNNAQNIVLKFTYPTGSLLKVWLQLIALTEGKKLTDEILMHLYHVAGLDLRKSLLQLQMLISSNKNFSKLSGEQVFYNEWWRRIVCDTTARWPVEKQIKHDKRRYHTIFSDDEDDSTNESNKKNSIKIPVVLKTESEKVSDLQALREYTSFFENVAFLGSLETNTLDLQMSFLNEEIYTCHFATTNAFHTQLNSDIADYIKAHIFCKFQEPYSALFSFNDFYNKIKQNTEIKEMNENVFNYYNPRPMDRFSKNCDYMSTIRDIARAERSKFSGNVKKSSRYFSYLKSVNIHITEKATDFLCNSLV